MKDFLKRINRRIPDSWRTDRQRVRACAGILWLCSPLDPGFRRELKQAADRCGSGSRARVASVKADMLRAYVGSWVTPTEYCKFGFMALNDQRRREYIAEHEGLAMFKRPEYNVLPNDKFRRYQMFSGYYHRELLHVTGRAGQAEEDSYGAFLKRHRAFIAKAIMGAKGHGVRKLTADEAPDTAALVARMGGECIVEELIEQGQPLAAFHPMSVNTVRFVTGADRTGRVYCLFALLRVGRGGSVVDNVGSGGLIALIDMDSGVVCTDGLCGLDYYETHPDTHVRFKGVQIPEWGKLCRTACELHGTQPGQRVFGFDFAWTTDGWDVVEVNPAPSFVSWQALTNRGIRPVLQDRGIL